MTTPVDLDAIRPISGADPDRDTRAENVDRAVQGAELLLRQAVVVGVDVPNGRCTVAIGGDTDNPVPGVKHLSNYRPKVDDSCWILVNGYDLLVLDRTTNLGPSVISDAMSSTVVATEFTTSSAFWTPLSGPMLSGISVSPSGRLLLQVSALLYNLTSGNYGALMGVNLVHTAMDFSVPPIETSSQIVYGTAANAAVAASKVILYTGLPAGLYNAQAQYLSLGGGGAQFQYRHIWALPL